MRDWLLWIEKTPVSAFVREDFQAYFLLLILHAWGMALLAGGAIIIGLRALGLGQGLAPAALRQLVPWMQGGAALAILSGFGLLAGYPAKALTNWVFAAKLVSLGAAALLVRHWLRQADKPGAGTARLAGAAMLALWLAGIAGGKLLLYTNSVLYAAELAP